MLQELFEFGDLTAGQVMVPRVRIAGIPLGTTPEQIRELLGHAHTRYPVYEGDLDHIIGMIHIKDVLRLLLRHEVLGREHARPLPLVPETAELDAVLATCGTSGRRWWSSSTSTAERRGSSRSRTCSRKSSARSTKGPRVRRRSIVIRRAFTSAGDDADR